MTGPEAIEIIQKLGISQRQFGRLVGLSANAITKWAKGQPPSPPTAALLRLLEHRPELLGVLRELDATAA
jgi:transcriptional regulator with XRE-family HTH domain